MFRILYIITIYIARLLLPVAGLFVKKAKTFNQERKNSQKVPVAKKKYWIHCASLGEYEMAVPIISELLKSNLLDDILITFFSPSGYTQAIKGPHSSSIMYLPIDQLSLVKQFYKDYAPQRAIFIRYDFWFNFIHEGQKRGIDFYLINGRFQGDHFILTTSGKPYLRLIKNFKKIYTSDEASAKILNTHTVAAEFSGDTRYDRVAEIVNSAPEYPDIADFIGSRKLLVVGSSWEEEEELIHQLLQDKPQNLAILIVPHDIKRSDKIVAQLKPYSPKKYTEQDFSLADDVLIVNTIGMLSGLYRYADFALVGGGFSGALHNILEPAVWGCHLFFGPRTQKFPEAQNFVEAGFAHKIESAEKWIDLLSNLLHTEDALTTNKTKAKVYCESMMGSTSHISQDIG
ncbi:MAG: glycosyltransferase N-terminal domain-containing protein [Bacteroidia bacterium]|nr:glycosyltransferase N-terminal domain-containing protein [Bacteroidia bacterium]